MIPTLPAPMEEAISAVKTRLHARFGSRLQSIRLFGSRAWGEPHAESDVDLCIVIDDLVQKERSEVMDMVADVAVTRDEPLSPMAWATGQLEHYLAIEYKLAQDIVERGVVL